MQRHAHLHNQVSADFFLTLWCGTQAGCKLPLFPRWPSGRCGGAWPIAWRTPTKQPCPCSVGQHLLIDAEIAHSQLSFCGHDSPIKKQSRNKPLKPPLYFPAQIVLDKPGADISALDFHQKCCRLWFWLKAEWLHRDTCKDLCGSYTVYGYSQRISVPSNIDFIHKNTGLCSHIVQCDALKEDTI